MRAAGGRDLGDDLVDHDRLQLHLLVHVDRDAFEAPESCSVQGRVQKSGVKMGGGSGHRGRTVDDGVEALVHLAITGRDSEQALLSLRVRQYAPSKDTVDYWASTQEWRGVRFEAGASKLLAIPRILVFHAGLH